MLWKPLADSALRERCRTCVLEIAESLTEAVDPGRILDPSLGVGLSGVALFLSYADRAHPSRGFHETSLACIERSQELVIGGRRWSPSLFGGLCGVTWTIEHLRPWIFEGEEDPLSDVDEALHRSLETLDREQPAELMGGLVGIGVYLLERLPNTEARLGLERLAAWFEETGGGNGSFQPWRSGARNVQRQVHNLGVAHGVPGVIGLLAQLYREGIASDLAKALILQAVRWLCNHRLPAGSDCRFPEAIGPGIEPVPARTAWCSGDLGIAAVILQASRSLGRRDWEKQALAWVRQAAKRSPERSRANDPSLCHGAAGLGHLFFRIHQATGDSVSERAATAWFERTLEMRRKGQGLAGFLSWSGDGQGGEIWRAEPGFLTGVAGIGLALLAATTEIEPIWDRVLLTAIPPQGRSTQDKPRAQVKPSGSPSASHRASRSIPSVFSVPVQLPGIVPG